MDSSSSPTIPIFVYLDNSNIFVSTQYYSSKQNNYKEGIMDIQCRMNTSKLIQIVLDGRNPTLKKAYGHMNKEVKHELDKAGFTVFLSDSLIGEKEVDTQLTADAVEDVVRHHFRTQGTIGIGNTKESQGHNGTLILLSGDKDMKPLIKLARKYEWDVEVWAYADSLSGALQIEMERKEYGSLMEVKPLENHFKDFVFYDDKIPEVIPQRTVLVRFHDRGVMFKRMSESSKEIVIGIVKEAAKSKFHLPLGTKVVEVDEVGIAVVIVLDDRKLKRPLYNFQTDVLEKLSEFEGDLKYQLQNQILKVTILINNLDPNLSDKDFYELVYRFGDIVTWEVEKDRRGKSRGQGVVTYHTELAASEALKHLNGTTFKNRTLFVRPHTPKNGIHEFFVTKFGDSKNMGRSDSRQAHGADSGNEPQHYKGRGKENERTNLEDRGGKDRANSRDFERRSSSSSGGNGNGYTSRGRGNASGHSSNGHGENGPKSSSGHRADALRSNSTGGAGNGRGSSSGHRGNGRSSRGHGGGRGGSTNRLKEMDDHPELHRAYKTKMCTRNDCDPSKCVRAHSLAEIRCYNCSGNHFSESCGK